MRQRRVEPEAMDAPGLDPAEHEAALRGLARLNRISGVAPLVYRRLRRIARSAPGPLRVLDIATGSGDLPIDWMKRAARDGVPLQITAADVSPHAIATAALRARRAGLATHTGSNSSPSSSPAPDESIRWLVANVLEDPLPAGFDAVTCSLFMHHLPNPQVARLLRAMRRATDGGGPVRRLLICDLARSRLNLAAVSAAAHLLSRSAMVHSDAAISVRAALTRREFAEVAEAALGIPVRVRILFPCRFLAEIEIR